MDRLIYVAMTGASQTMCAQATVSHNLANAATTGFRSDLTAITEQAVNGPGLQSRVNAVAMPEGMNTATGSIVSTGVDLDVAVEGEGLIAVQAPDGSEAYTRAGDLRVTSGGVLTNGAGHPVMGEGGPVAIPPHAGLTVGVDGTVSIQPLGSEPNTLAAVDRIKLVNPPVDTLEKGDDGLLRPAGNQPVETDASVRLVSGALETSNVNVADAMVNMIELARQYEAQVQIMHTADDNARAAARLLQVP